MSLCLVRADQYHSQEPSKLCQCKHCPPARPPVSSLLNHTFLDVCLSHSDELCDDAMFAFSRNVMTVVFCDLTAYKDDTFLII